MVLDGSIFSNVSITNGRLISDGSRTVAAGLTFPGLAESLNIDNGKLDIPGYIEVSANVKKFDFDGTYTIVTNEPFREASKKEKDEDILDADELSDSMDELSDAMVSSWTALMSFMTGFGRCLISHTSWWTA